MTEIRGLSSIRPRIGAGAGLLSLAGVSNLPAAPRTSLEVSRGGARAF
jgi:hypothetical protein